DLGSERTGLFDGGRREISARYVSAEPRPTKSVEAEMALKVEQIPALDWTDFVQFICAKFIEAPLEGLDLIEVGSVINWGPLVPQGAISLEILLHRSNVLGFGHSNRLKFP